MIRLEGMQVNNFNFKNQLVRVIERNGQAYFVGNDVAKALGYSSYRHAVMNHVDNDDKLRVHFEHAGQLRMMMFINESGVFALIFGSKLPEAKKFKHWVTSDVLPSIFHTGGYQMKPMTPTQKIAYLASNTSKAFKQVNQGLAKNTNDIHFLKKNMPLNHAQKYRLMHMEHHIVTQQLGGYKSNAYNKYSRKAFSQGWRDFKNHFQLTRYDELPNAEFDDGISFLRSWHLSGNLLENVKSANSQTELRV